MTRVMRCFMMKSVGTSVVVADLTVRLRKG